MSAGQYLSLPAAATGLAPISSATAWAFGTPVAVATMATDIEVISFNFQNTDIPAVEVIQEILFEITVDGTTKLQIPFSIGNDSLVGYDKSSPRGTSNIFYLPEPYFIPAGSVVAIKVCDSIAAALTYNGVKILYNELSHPTTALNSPADASSDSDTTPTLNFTGTDSDAALALEYQVQVDTVNTFDSVEGWSVLNETNNGTNRRTTVMWKRAKAGDTDPLLTHIGGGQVRAIIANFRGVVASGNPFSVVGTPSDNAASLTITANAITPNAGDHVIFISVNSATAPTYNVTNPTLSARFHSTTISMGSADSAGGATGDNTATVTFSSINFGQLISLIPAGGVTYQAVGTEAVVGSGNATPALPADWAVDDIFIAVVSTADNITSSPPPSTPLISASSATDAGFTSGHPFASATPIDYTVQSALTAPDTYYWRVRAARTGSTDWGDWSSIRSFDVTAGTTAGTTETNTVTATQSAVLVAVVTKTETASIIATQNNNLIGVVTKNETVTVIDTKSNVLITVANETETGTVIDSQNAGLVVIVTKTETINVIDNSNRVLTISAGRTEAGTITDFQNNILIGVISKTEILSVFDSQSNVMIGIASQTETSTALNSEAVSLILSVVKTEELSVSDLASAVATVLVGTVETGVVIDFQNNTKITNANKTESLSISDLVSAISILLAGKVEALSVSDLTALTNIILVSATETGTVTDYQSKILIAIANKTETNTVIATQGNILIGLVSKTEIGTVIDSQGNVMIGIASKTETGTVTDNSNRGLVTLVSKTEVLSILDLVLGSAILLVGKTEIGSLIANQSNVMIGVVEKTEGLSVFDLYIVFRGFKIAIGRDLVVSLGNDISKVYLGTIQL